jgi:hypothetical protein
MLEHANQDEGVFLKFLLASGFRDREVRHVYLARHGFSEQFGAAAQQEIQLRTIRNPFVIQKHRSTFDLLRYRTPQEASYAGDIRDKQTRF